MATPSKPIDRTQIVRLTADLSKASSDPQSSASTISSLLQQLRAGVNATEDLLRSTKVGIVVNKLIKDEKASKDESVRKEAHDLVMKWKRDIQAKKGGASPRPGTAPQPGASKPTAVANGEKKSEPAGEKKESAPAAPATSEKWKSLPPEQRSAEKDGADYKVLGTPARNNCLKLLYDGLVFMQKEHGEFMNNSSHHVTQSNTPAAPSHILPIAMSIEQEVFKCHGPDTSQPYKDKIRSLFINLKSRDSPHLRDALLSTPQSITPERLVKMTPEELKSPEQAARDNELAARNKNNAIVGKDQKAISDILTCPQCKQKKVSYTQAQTRSADEPMTTFCECLNCGRKWKFS